MSDFTARLKKALEFPQGETTPFDWARSRYVIGGQHENARLAPIHAALVECVKALEEIEGYIGDYAQILAEEKLKALDAVLSKKQSEE